MAHPTVQACRRKGKFTFCPGRPHDKSANKNAAARRRRAAKRGEIDVLKLMKDQSKAKRIERAMKRIADLNKRGKRESPRARRRRG